MLLKSTTSKLETGCGNMYVTYTHNPNGDITHIIPILGKNGTCANTFLNTIAEALTSLMQLSKNQKILFLTKMAGHRCQYKEKTCVDVLVRDILHLIIKGGENNELR